MKKTFLILASLLLLLHGQAMAAVRAFLNQDHAYIGDPVTLTIEVDGNSNARPDLTVLKKSFRILGTGTSSNVSIVNGVTSSKKSWNVTLMPQGKGQLTIPAIQVGAEKSQPLMLTVTDVPAEVKAQLRDHVILEAETGNHNDTVHVQQQISYILKLYTDDDVVSGELIAPQIKNAVVEQISEDKRYRATRNGKTFNVLERHYVISPERSGRLNIPPAQFRGKLKQPRKKQPSSRRRSPLDDFFNRDGFFNDPFSQDFFNDPFSDDFFAGTPFGNPGKPIRTSSNALSIKVLPVPKNYHGQNWLPAEEIQIQDSWDEHLPPFKVGEPVIRSLRFQAKGLSGSQIPELTLPEPNGMRLYPEPAKTETRTDGETVYGISEQSITYIPNQAGNITIPKVSIDWWNTRTGKQETVTLPARVIEVKPGAAKMSKPAPNNSSAEKKSANKPATSKPDFADQQPATSTSGNRSLWVVIGIAAAAILLGLLWRLIKPQKKRTTKQPTQPAAAPKTRIDKRAIKKALQQACENNNASEAARQLLKLAAATWPQNPPQSLGALASRVTKGQEAIRELDRQLYASADSQWQGAQLWTAVRDGLKGSETHDNNEQTGIAGLYPGHD